MGETAGDDMIDQLPVLLPDPSRAHRTRLRCQKKLIQQHRAGLSRRIVVERAIVCGFGAVYLCSIAIGVLQVVLR